jgi:hypothetical protein
MPPGGRMNIYERWNENRSHISPGKYNLKCIEFGKVGFWLRGKNGWGKSEKIYLIFEVFEGDYQGTLLPMFFTISNRVPQGCKFYLCWVIANGMRKPTRGRLKEMSPKKFLNKVFEGEVVTVQPKWNVGMKANESLPELFHYSCVSMLHELVIGDPNINT